MSKSLDELEAFDHLESLSQSDKSVIMASQLSQTGTVAVIRAGIEMALKIDVASNPGLLATVWGHIATVASQTHEAMTLVAHEIDARARMAHGHATKEDIEREIRERENAPSIADVLREAMESMERNGNHANTNVGEVRRNDPKSNAQPGQYL